MKNEEIKFMGYKRNEAWRWSGSAEIVESVDEEIISLNNNSEVFRF